MMTKAQEKTIEKIRTYVLEHDCYRNHPDYEIKRFEVEKLGCGRVEVNVVSGRKNDTDTLAEVFCRSKVSVKRTRACTGAGPFDAYDQSDGYLLVLKVDLKAPSTRMEKLKS